MDALRAAGNVSPQQEVAGASANTGLAKLQQLRTQGLQKYRNGTALAATGAGAIGAGLVIGLKLLGILALVGLSINPIGASVLCGVLLIGGAYMAYKGLQARKAGKGDISTILDKKIDEKTKILQEKKEILAKMKSQLEPANKELGKQMPHLQKTYPYYCKKLNLKSTINTAEEMYDNVKLLQQLVNGSSVRIDDANELWQDYSVLENSVGLSRDINGLERQVSRGEQELNELQSALQAAAEELKSGG